MLSWTYGTHETKTKPSSPELRRFRAQIDKVSEKLNGYQDEVSNTFGDVLAIKPSKDQLTARLTQNTVRWSCVHETQEVLTLAIPAMLAIKASVTDATLQDYQRIVSCLDETASQQYARLMLSENRGLWTRFYSQIWSRFSSLQKWAESHPKQYKAIKCTAAATGLFAAVGVASLVAHFLPATLCALSGPVFVIGGLICLAIGGCGLGIAHKLEQQKEKKAAFNGALLKMIQDLNKDMTGSNPPDLSEVLRLLKAVREQAAIKWGGMLTPEQQQALRPHIGECAVCLNLRYAGESLVVPITGVAECMDAHVFHAHCIPEQGACPLCRRNYLGQKHLPAPDNGDS